MDFTDLKIFKDFYIFRNLTEVSRMNYISQPSVSYRLSKMQAELKTKLYEYNGDYLFTETGKVFYEFCKKTIEDFNHLLIHMQTRELLVVNLSAAAAILYLERVYELLSRYRLSIEISHSETVIKNVVEGKAFFGIIGGFNLEVPKFIEKRVLKIEQIVLAFHASLDDDIEKIPVILDERSSGLYSLEKKYLNSFKKVKTVAEVGTGYEKMGLVEKNMAGIFVSREYAESNLKKYNNIRLSRNYSFDREIYMLYQKKNRNNKLIKEIIENI